MCCVSAFSIEQGIHIFLEKASLLMLHVYLNVFCIPDTKLHARTTTVNTLYISALELN